MGKGWVKSYRKKWTHPVFRNLLEAAMWSWLCETAAWEDTKVRYNGKLVNLERGQLITSLRFLSKGFEVGEQVTRTFLENLENEGMINTQPTRHGTIITICNYDKYQLSTETDNTPDNTQTTHVQHTSNTNNKELNKLKEGKEGNARPAKRRPVSDKKSLSEFSGLAVTGALEDQCDRFAEFLPEQWRKYAEGRGWGESRIYYEARSFWRYWTGPDAKGPRKADWYRTWCNRIDLLPARSTSPAGSDADNRLRDRVNATARAIDNIC